MELSASDAQGESPPAPRGWHPLAAAVWTVLAFVLQYAVIFLVVFAWGATHPGGVQTLADLSPVSPIVWVGTLAALPFQLGVLYLATRFRGGFLRHLGLVWPDVRRFLEGIAVLIAVLLAMDGLTLLLGRSVVPPFMIEAYTAARDAHALFVFVAAVVIAAPVWEELLFRGFLYRSLSQTRLRAAGAVVVTALIWAVVHIQYDWYGIVQICLIGLVLGWLRVRSGSTYLTVILHGLANLVATVQVFMTVEGSF